MAHKYLEVYTLKTVRNQEVAKCFYLLLKNDFTVVFERI